MTNDVAKRSCVGDCVAVFVADEVVGLGQPLDAEFPDVPHVDAVAPAVEVFTVLFGFGMFVEDLEGHRCS